MAAGAGGRGKLFRGGVPEEAAGISLKFLIFAGRFGVGALVSEVKSVVGIEYMEKSGRM